jgi:3-deoxy-D-manno-octulosonic-acid transferase
VLARAWVRLPRTLRSEWQVVAIARHRRAAAEIRREAAERGVATVALAGVEVPLALAADAWGWDDRPGVLASYYAAAEVAFVGGSLAPFGGHNPMEPAATGAAIVMGPHHVTQRDAVQSLLAKRALVVEANDRGLAEIFESWLSNQAEREQAGSAALQVAAARRGAARRTATRLAAIGLWPARKPATFREGRG